MTQAPTDLERPWNTYRYAVVDVEGNGQRPPDLVELAIVPITDGVIGNARQWLVKPPRPITAMARRFHKITDEDVAGQPATAAVAHEIRAALEDAVLVAHNAHVDLAVIGRELDYAAGIVIDTLKLARRFAPGQSSYKLGRLVDTLRLQANGENAESHRAGYDALMCARLLKALAETAPTLTLADLIDDPSRSRTDQSDAPPLF